MPAPTDHGLAPVFVDRVRDGIHATQHHRAAPIELVIQPADALAEPFIRSTGPPQRRRDPLRVWRLALRSIGNVLIIGSLLGLAALSLVLVMPASPATPAPGQAGVAMQQALNAVLGSTSPGGRRAADSHPDPGTTSTLPSASASIATSGVDGAQATPGRGFPPITHISVPAIDLDADVVPARLIPLDGGMTWEVPAFKVGHAESTAGAGQLGNAVLLGHVTSVHSGNVFADLDRTEVGDLVQVFADDRAFSYRVVSISRLPWSDDSALEPGDVPAVSLITCTGVWLPTIWDYTERLVVRAELAQAAPD